MGRFTKGWVKAWRDQIDGDLPENIWLWGIWHWLLLAATWKPTKILWKGKQREIPPGTVVMGLGELAVKWECSKNTIKRWLQYLEETDRISVESCTRGTLVTIRNWDLYQAKETSDDTPTAHELHTDCTRTAHELHVSKEGKKEEVIHAQPKRCSGVKSPFDLETLYKGYPRQRGKSRGLKKLSKDIRSQEDYDQLAVAIRNYAAEVSGRDEDKIKYFDTFAGEWRDWIKTEPRAAPYSINTKPINIEEIA